MNNGKNRNKDQTPTDAGVPESHAEDPHTEDRGAQERPMTEAEALQEALEDSMDASDPPAIVQPGGGEPAPSSGFDEETERRIAEELAAQDS